MLERSFTWLSDPALAARAARLLWIAWAIVVWNVVFDRVLVLAGREYVYAASVATRTSGRYLSASDWMSPAVTRSLWLATTAACAILAIGLASIPLATRRLRTGAPQ